MVVVGRAAPWGPWRWGSQWYLGPGPGCGYEAGCRRPRACPPLPHPVLLTTSVLPHARPSLLPPPQAALASPTIPPEIVTALLNLAEFMEHDDKRLPLDTRTLGALAEKCHAFAKALHYKVGRHCGLG